MVIQMLLAHLIGDFVLQTDKLAAWKSRCKWGVLAHGGIVLGVTVLFAALYRPSFMGWALFIGVTHIAIDYVNLKSAPLISTRGLSSLLRFVLDQGLHFAAIMAALYFSGDVAAVADVTAQFNDPVNTGWLYALIYTFMSMPAWVTIEFFVSGLLSYSAPDFKSATKYKYIGMYDRWVLTTTMLSGWWLLLILLPLARMTWQNPGLFAPKAKRIKLSEWAVGGLLALTVRLMVV